MILVQFHWSCVSVWLYSREKGLLATLKRLRYLFRSTCIVDGYYIAWVLCNPWHTTTSSLKTFFEAAAYSRKTQRLWSAENTDHHHIAPFKRADASTAIATELISSSLCLQWVSVSFFICFILYNFLVLHDCTNNNNNKPAWHASENTCYMRMCYCQLAILVTKELP